MTSDIWIYQKKKKKKKKKKDAYAIFIQIVHEI